jgi:hypothetical protein
MISMHISISYVQLTGSGISCHVNDRVSAVDNIVMGQGGRSTSHLDIIAYLIQIIVYSCSELKTHHSGLRSQ